MIGAEAFRPLALRLGNMLARGRLASRNGATKMQTLQVELLADEVKDRMEHFEPYGFTSAPQIGAEIAAMFLDGDRSHGIVVMVADRRYRITGLVDGEVCIHDDLGQRVHLTRAGIVINGGGLPIVVTNASTITLDTPKVVMTGVLEVNGASLTHQGVNVGSGHKHSGVQAGGGNTGAPV